MYLNKEQKSTSLPLFGIPRLLPFLKPYRARMFRMVFLALICSVVDVSYPLFNRYALDHFVAEGTLEGLPPFILLYLAVLAFQSVINYISMADSGTVEMSVDKDLRNKAFNHLQTLSFSYFNQNSVGYIHARVMSDTGKIGEAVSWRMMDCIWNGSYILFAIVVMFMTQIRLAFWMVMLMALAGLLLSYFQKKLVEVNRRIREMNSKITGDFNEGITGARSIKLLGIEDKMQKEFEDDTETFRKESVRAVRHSAMLLSTVTFMSSAALALVLWQGGILTREGVIRIGTLSVFVSYAVGMVEPLQFIIQNISAFIAIQVNIERFTDLLAEPPDVADSPEVVSRYGDSFHPKYENWEELKGDIEFRDVTFRYPDGEENVLEHFNLKVPHGQNIAIVGETGAGKSTLVNLVCRFYEPTEGAVLIDGRDARERSQLWLHSHIGYVLQTPHLFSGSVRENLRYGRPDATDEEVILAAREAEIYEDIMQMPDGFDTYVGERGTRLSGGQRQRISIARIFLKNPAILILDEATSALDTITEERIQHSFDSLMENRTSFVIAHRLSTVRNADRIIVIENGHVVEEGTHAQLLALNGEYAQLYEAQEL